jgi:hypothetical protein
VALGKFTGPYRAWDAVFSRLLTGAFVGSLGNRRPLRGLRLPRLIRELWLRVLRVFLGRVYAVGEDILLSERDGQR